jgi:hypothetical protein
VLPSSSKSTQASRALIWIFLNNRRSIWSDGHGAQPV